MIKVCDTVIFDLDGTLADTAVDVQNGVNHALDEMGYSPLPINQVMQAIGPGKEEFVKIIFPEEDNPDMKSFLEIFRQNYWDHCLDQTKLFPGIYEVIKEINGRKLAVASNKPKKYTEKILDGLGIKSFFNRVVGPEDVKRPKPYPDMILKVLELIGSSHQNTLFVGDTDKDMRAGKDAGVKLCGVRYGYGSSEDIVRLNPDYMIDCPEELLAILNHT